MVVCWTFRWAENFIRKEIQNQWRFNSNWNSYVFFFCGAVDRKNAMIGNGRELFGVIIVIFIRRGAFFNLFGCDTSGTPGYCANFAPVICRIGNVLGYNIPCSGKRIFCGIYFLFFIYIFFCNFFYSFAVVFLLLKQKRCKRFEAFFPCRGCSCLSVLLVRTIDVFKFCKCFCFVKRCGDFRCKLALSVNQRRNFFPAFVKSAEIIQPFRKCPENSVVQRTGNFLSVSGNERNSVSFVYERYGFLNLFFFDSELIW